MYFSFISASQNVTSSQAYITDLFNKRLNNYCRCTDLSAKEGYNL